MTLSGSNVSLQTREHFDWPLFIAASLVAVVGIVNLYSATSVYTATRSELYLNQIYWFVAGGILAVIIAWIDTRLLEQTAYIQYAVGIILLITVLVIGKDVRGSSRWIFGFQPSEIMKVFLILALAKYFHNDPSTDAKTLRELIIPAVLAIVPIVLVKIQPDLGTSIILGLVFVSTLGLIRIRWTSLVLATAGGVATVWGVWKYGLHGYQLNRINVWLNPEFDTQGLGWQSTNARVAIGNGGFWGEGYAKGTQNQHGFLPDQYTDFPFPVFAEDWGFVGSLVLLALYAFLILWSIRIAALAKDRFGAIVAVGVGSMFFWHTIANIGMAVGLLPVVGITLPMFSYGGSSVLTMVIGIGLLMNVSLRRYSSTPFSRGPRPLIGL